MMSKVAALLLVGLVAVSASTQITSLCTAPMNNTQDFGREMCSADDTVYSTEYTIQCTTGSNPVAVPFTYNIAGGDAGMTIFFVLYPDTTSSLVNWQIATSVPAADLLHTLDAYSYTASSGNTNGGQSQSDSWLVSWVDAKTTYEIGGQLKNPATFSVTCTGTNTQQAFWIGAFQGGAALSWDSVGPSQGVYGATVTAAAPCCGVAQVSWSLAAQATQHLYIDAELNAVQGKWASAKMVNVGVYLDDQQPFGGNGFGTASVRTCVTNQSCTTQSDDGPYYVQATTSGANAVTAWVSLQMTLKASSATVGVSLATIAAVVIANLL